MALIIEHITFDCHDARALAGFWSTATGQAIEDDWGDFVRLAPGRGGIRLAFQEVPENKIAKNRMHLDINSDDMVETVNNLVAPGGWSVMPLRRSAVGRASRKDEASSLLGWNGEAEDAASGDDRPSRYVTCITDRPPQGIGRRRTFQPQRHLDRDARPRRQRVLRELRIAFWGNQN